MGDLLERVAGGPITWGVDGSPGWGYLLDSDRVLSEMRSAGLSATELGPDGFLPSDPGRLVDYVARYELQVVGGFVPAVLYQHRGIEEQMVYIDRANAQLAATGSEFIILGPDSHHDGYDVEVELSAEEWDAFFSSLRRVMNNAEEHGLATAVHPHWGMAVSRKHHVERMLESCDAGLCLDTGHLFLSGCDPLEIAKIAGDRVNHVHLKDVDDRMADLVRAGELPFREAVIRGMFKPLGNGAVDIGSVIRYLEANGYRGWYVLEQDCALSEEPADGEGPLADAVASVEFLQRLAREV